MMSNLGFGQNKNDWTSSEITRYKNLMDLAEYIDAREKSEISNDTLFEKYIYFDYVLNDTDTERKNKRLHTFDTVFYYFRIIVDSIGLENFEAKPVRFYRDHEIYIPFEKESAMETVDGEKMYTREDNVFVFYRKEEPENPLGTLLFEPTSDKLVSWLLINQGGYKYFLTFNML